MNGAFVLRVMGLILLLLGGAGILSQLVGSGSPVMWLGAIGPVLMGIAMFVIAQGISGEGD